MTLFTHKHALFYSLSLCLVVSISQSSVLPVWFAFCGAFVSMLTFSVLFLRFYARMPFWPLSPVNLATPLSPSSFPFPVSFCLQSSLLHECLYTRIHSYICHTRSYIFIVDFYGHLLMQKLFEQNKQNENV